MARKTLKDLKPEGAVIPGITGAGKPDDLISRINDTITNFKGLAKIVMDLRSQQQPAGGQVIEGDYREAPPPEPMRVGNVKQLSQPAPKVVTQPPASLASVANELYQLIKALGFDKVPIGTILDKIKDHTLDDLIKGGGKIDKSGS